MTVYQKQNLDDREEEAYDLETEKRRIAEGTEEIRKELLEKWQKRYANARIFPDKLQQMNSAVIDFLLSFENTLFYNHLEKKFSLNQNQRDFLPQIVWKICLEKKWDILENLIITNLNTPQAREIAEDINANILFKTKELSEKGFPLQKSRFTEEPTNNLIKISLSDALKKYPELGEQLITGNKIKLKNFPDVVRPSINNWLSDYTFNMGYENHSTMDRGNFLFQNENARVLNPLDREKLSYVLKAFDENNLVAINITTKQIMFPRIEVVSKPRTEKIPAVGSGRRLEPDNSNKPAFNTNIYDLNRKIQRKELPSRTERFLPTGQAGKSGDLNRHEQPIQTIDKNPNFKAQIPNQIQNPNYQNPKPISPAKINTVPSNITPDSNMNKMQFSSPQTLPFEKEKIQPTAPQPLHIGSSWIQEKNAEKRELPKNLINLKE